MGADRGTFDADVGSKTKLADAGLTTSAFMVTTATLSVELPGAYKTTEQGTLIVWLLAMKPLRVPCIAVCDVQSIWGRLATPTCMLP
mmetsp:Transcript_63025/g.195136  ORF Transcript_63025/g.195136 Transcript_63025/m.195136 type:complete len:87 (-) Transcript_63025:391-651(-)